MAKNDGKSWIGSGHRQSVVKSKKRPSKVWSDGKQCHGREIEETVDSQDGWVTLYMRPVTDFH